MYCWRERGCHRIILALTAAIHLVVATAIPCLHTCQPSVAAHSGVCADQTHATAPGHSMSAGDCHRTSQAHQLCSACLYARSAQYDTPSVAGALRLEAPPVCPATAFCLAPSRTEACLNHPARAPPCCV